MAATNLMITLLFQSRGILLKRTIPLTNTEENHGESGEALVHPVELRWMLTTGFLQQFVERYAEI